MRSLYPGRKYFRLWILAIMAGVYILNTASCQFDPFAERYTTKKPLSKDLEGIYKLKMQMVDKSITSYKDKTTGNEVLPVIKLHSDGRYEALNIPDFKKTEGSSYEYAGVISSEGTWETKVVGCVSSREKGCTDYWGIRFTGLPEILNTCALMENSPPYELLFTAGDPDGAMIINYEKIIK